MWLEGCADNEVDFSFRMMEEAYSTFKAAAEHSALKMLIAM